MKAVKYLTQVMHYVFFCAASISVLALISLTGAPVRNMVSIESSGAYTSLVMAFGIAFAVSFVLYKLDSIVQRYVNSRV